MRILLSLAGMMLAAGPAQSIDCARAVTAVERAICGDAIGCSAEGTYACTFPLSGPMALARPDSPLP